MDLPVHKVESLLNTTYSLYRHTDGSTLVRAPEWSLPEDLHEYIDLIQPTTSFFQSSKPSIRPAHEHGQVKRHQEGDRLEVMPDDVSLHMWNVCQGYLTHPRVVGLEYKGLRHQKTLRHLSNISFLFALPVRHEQIHCSGV